MTTILHLGVMDIPYQHPERPPRRVGKPRKGVRKGSRFRQSDFMGGGQTTGDVAEILEAKYQLMRTFFEIHENKIVDSITASIKGSLENLLAGAPTTGEPFQEATDEIEKIFKLFLDQKGFDGLIPGVPTKASLKGVNHRLKHPYAKTNPTRPSFIDTGQYQATFKAWVDS